MLEFNFLNFQIQFGRWRLIVFQNSPDCLFSKEPKAFFYFGLAVFELQLTKYGVKIKTTAEGLQEWSRVFYTEHKHSNNSVIWLDVIQEKLDVWCLAKGLNYAGKDRVLAPGLDIKLAASWSQSHILNQIFRSEPWVFGFVETVLNVLINKYELQCAI